MDTINKHLSNLEQDLCYKLLINDGRSTQLTSRGHELTKHITNIEEIFNQIYDATDRCSIDCRVRSELYSVVGQYKYFGS